MANNVKTEEFSTKFSTNAPEWSWAQNGAEDYFSKRIFRAGTSRFLPVTTPFSSTRKSLGV